QILDICIGFDTRRVTVHAFAIANFNRPPDKVCTLMKLAEERLVKIAQDGCCLCVFRSQLIKRREMTHQNNKYVLSTLAFHPEHTPTEQLYKMTAHHTPRGMGRHVQSVVQQALDRENFGSSLITEQIIEENLITSLWGSPPLEIFIRTRGVKRLSSFLQWQVCLLLRKHAVHVVNTYWPGFSLWDFVLILLDYRGRCGHDRVAEGLGAKLLVKFLVIFCLRELLCWLCFHSASTWRYTESYNMASSLQTWRGLILVCAGTYTT
ncbi:putative undecaprenyl diphosphate synthase-domain-containing protein, partial [Suillus tomentosus]